MPEFSPVYIASPFPSPYQNLSWSKIFLVVALLVSVADPNTFGSELIFRIQIKNSFPNSTISAVCIEGCDLKVKENTVLWIRIPLEPHG